MPPGILMPTAPSSKTTANLDASGNASGIDPDAWKKKSFWQLFNISVGFLGIQFAWAIQMGQMSPLLERLGSNPQWLSWISCAGPVTGVLVQPIIGALSDGCKLSIGRRRPFLLLGALLTAVALIFMPSSTELWIHNLFYLGASAMVLAILWTVITTPEPAASNITAPKEFMDPPGNFFVDTIKSIGSMPTEGLKL